MTSQAALDHLVCITGKSMTMLSAIFKILKLNVQQFYLKLRYGKGFTWQARGQSRLYLLCDTGDVQYFCHVREDTATALFDFYRHKTARV